MQIGKRCASCYLTLILVLELASGTKGMNGQHVGETAIATSWPEVNVNVVVLDKQGTPQKVDEREFLLFEDGSQRPLQFRGSLDSPVSLALMIDSSGSIFKRTDAITTAVKALVEAMPHGSEVMAVAFADKAYLDLPFTAVDKVDFSFLERLQTRGPTALYDAVIATEDHFIAQAKYARRALVILSDGEDNSSSVSKKLAFSKMKRPGAPVVYACIPSKAKIMQSELIAGHINMKFLAKEGGGTEINLDPDPELPATTLADAIRSQYALRFTSADPNRNGKARKLTVRLPSNNVRVYAMPTYFAPAQ